MKISVIIPSFNQAGFLKETLDSVLEQPYANREVLVVDGGSTDGSAAIIERYADRLTWWVSEKDRGQSHAINKGLERATGDIVCWLNSDDLHGQDTLETVARFFRDNPGKGALQGAVLNLYPKNRDLRIAPEEVSEEDLVRRVPFHQPGVFWRRELLDRTGLLDESLHFCMDYDLWMRLYFNTDFGYTNQVLAKFRVHGESKTHGNPKAMYLEYRKVLSRLFLSANAGTASLLERFGVYDNPEHRTYTLDRLPRTPVDRLASIYLYECAVQEYSWGNPLKAARLARAGHSGSPVRGGALRLWLKSVSGLAYLRRIVR